MTLDDSVNGESLQYPFDSMKIIRRQRKLKKKLLQRDDIVWIKKRIAVLGGSTTEEVVKFIELFLLAEGIEAQFHQCDYGQYWEAAVFPTEELLSFNPDLILVHTSTRNLAFMQSEYQDTSLSTMIADDISKFTQMLEALETTYRCPIIQNNFEKPIYRPYGNQDICNAEGFSNYVFHMNEWLNRYVQQHEAVFVHDIDYLSADYGLSRWHDLDSWCLYKNAFSISALPDYAYSVTRVVKALFGRNKKILVTDLDNTLWDGVVGDDGIEGITMGSETATGEKHRFLQQYLLDIANLGVLLAVDSKNDANDAEAGLGHRDSLLNKEHFASIKANWQQKDLNIREMAQEIALGVEGFVFLDDNPAEREIVAQGVPDVSVVEFEDVGQAVHNIDRAGYFEPIRVTNDDLSRSKMYKDNAIRKASESKFESYEDYLASLEMKSEALGFIGEYISRIAQLTNKTNQFNLTTKRYTEEDIKDFSRRDDCVCLAFRLVDRFGDNGLISVVLGVIRGNQMEIDLWLMSCRVLKRGLENYAFCKLCEAALERGVNTIKGTYAPTKKNRMVENFYRDIGFVLLEECKDGSTQWIYEVSDVVINDTQIREM